MNHIPVGDLKDRGVYRIVSRNLAVGVFNAKANGFVGIREKFGSRFLDIEYHWDTGADGKGTYGTACPTRLLEIQLPEGIPASELLEPLLDRDSGREVVEDNTEDPAGIYRHNYKSVVGYRFKDTGEAVGKNEKGEYRSIGYRSNDALFDFLDKLEKDLTAKDPEWHKHR